MGNPYHDLLEDRYRLQRVRVVKDGVVYTGIYRVMGYNDEAFHLDDATIDGEPAGSVTIQSADTIALDDPADAPTIEHINPENVGSLPYNQADYDSESFHDYVMQTRLRGGIGSYPKVRPTGDSPLTDEDGADYEIVEGHKRAECARRAGIGPTPMVVTDLSDWEVTLRYMDDHYPAKDPHHIRSHFGSNHNSYSEDEYRASIRALRADWPTEKLREHPGYRAVSAALEQPDDTDSENTPGYDRVGNSTRPSGPPSSLY